jgi:hypothetical protein
MEISSMLYADGVFITPPNTQLSLPEAKGSEARIKRQEVIYSQAAILITGAIYTTTTNVIVAYANKHLFRVIKSSSPPINILICYLFSDYCHHLITRFRKPES